MSHENRQQQEQEQRHCRNTATLKVSSHDRRTRVCRPIVVISRHMWHCWNVSTCSLCCVMFIDESCLASASSLSLSLSLCVCNMVFALFVILETTNMEYHSRLRGVVAVIVCATAFMTAWQSADCACSTRMLTINGRKTELRGTSETPLKLETQQYCATSLISTCTGHPRSDCLFWEARQAKF